MKTHNCKINTFIEISQIGCLDDVEQVLSLFERQILERVNITFKLLFDLEKAVNDWYRLLFVYFIQRLQAQIIQMLFASDLAKVDDSLRKCVHAQHSRIRVACATLLLLLFFVEFREGIVVILTPREYVIPIAHIVVYEWQTSAPCFYYT